MQKTALVIMAAGIGSRFEKESSSLHRWEHVERLLWIIPSTMRWKPDLTK